MPHLHTAQSLIPLLHSNSLSLMSGMLPLDTDQGGPFTPYQYRDVWAVVFMASIATPSLPTMKLLNSLQI